MMQALLFVLGVAILLLTAFDLLWTTFVEGAGPLNRRSAMRLARILRSLRMRLHTRRLHTWSGLIIVLVTFLTWTVLIWVGWSLIFCSAGHAVVNAATGQPADVWSRIYFAGYCIFTLGLGDYIPHGALFQVATVFCTGSGFFLFGVAVAYLVPVTAAATQKRQLALTIWALGKSPADIIMRAWNGADTSALGPHFVSMVPMLALLGENHLTYPVLHFFFSSKRSSSIGPAIASLDEAITVLECGLQKGCSLDLPALGAVRTAIDDFLATIGATFISAVSTAPPAPSLQQLRDMGIPVADDATFKAAVEQLAPRRKLLLGLVLRDGYDWAGIWAVPR